jgi:hypothetical protein
MHDISLFRANVLSAGAEMAWRDAEHERSRECGTERGRKRGGGKIVRGGTLVEKEPNFGSVNIRNQRTIKGDVRLMDWMI